jgi:hypothetical protein
LKSCSHKNATLIKSSERKTAPEHIARIFGFQDHKISAWPFGTGNGQVSFRNSPGNESALGYLRPIGRPVSAEPKIDDASGNNATRLGELTASTVSLPLPSAEAAATAYADWVRRRYPY